MTVISRSTAPAIDARLRAELWRRIDVRLADGETLATGGQLLSAIESAYRDLTGRVPSADTRRQLRRLVQQVNDERPETYLALGVQNAVQLAFARGVESLRWSLAHVERYGSASVRRFLHRDRIRDFLQDIQLDPGLIDVAACVRNGAARVQANAGGRSTRASKRPPTMMASTGALQSEDLDAAQLLVVVQAGLAPAEARHRLQELERLRRLLHDRVIEDLPTTIDAYVDDGTVAEEEADSFRLRVEGDTAAAPSFRLTRAVADTVACLQVFESLQRIRAEYDDLFRTLIQHKQLVVVGDEGDRTQLMTALLRTPGFQELAVAVMGRRDPELRLLVARAAPYDRLEASETQGDLTVEGTFVDDLRRLSAKDYARKLQAKDRTERARALSDLRGFIQLVNRLIGATPFRRKVRLVIANRILTECTPEIETIYRTGEAVSQSRARAEALLNEKLRPVFAEASPEELEAARRRRAGLLMTIEQKLVEATGEDVDQIMAPLLRADGAETRLAVTESPAQEEELADIEKSRGALLADVEIRVEGRPQKLPGVVMPSPEDSKRMVIVERDPATGELTPQLKRGRLRYVNRRADGSWQALTG